MILDQNKSSNIIKLYRYVERLIKPVQRKEMLIIA